jgi:predicted nucleotidyltransferase
MVPMRRAHARDRLAPDRGVGCAQPERATSTSGNIIMSGVGGKYPTAEWNYLDGICYLADQALIDRLRDDAREADELHERSRRILVDTARAAAAAGMTQREILQVIGRSQPEVSRLLRFHGRSPLGRLLENNRPAVLRKLSAAGARNPRVFGSVSRGEDWPESDIDIMVDFTKPIGLFELAHLELELAELLGAPVELTIAKSFRPYIASRSFADAIQL